MRKRTSIIWQSSNDEFRELVKNCKTMSQLLRSFGLENKGGNYKTCRKRIEELNIDTSHFLGRLESSHLTTKVTLEQFQKEALKENSTYHRFDLKKRLIKFNLLKYQCNKCGNNGVWQNEKLSLQIEHKNGINNDNRLENLCFLCPNCHSQTPTYAGKRLKKQKPICKKCNKEYPGYGEVCNKCSKKTKINWPAKEELVKMTLVKPMRVIAKELNVSDNGLKKHCKKIGISFPDRRGYWQKKKAGKI